MEWLYILLALLALGVGIFVGYWFAFSNYQKLRRGDLEQKQNQKETAEKEAAEIRRRAQEEAEKIRQTAELETKAKAIEAQARLEEEIRRERESIRVERQSLKSEREEARRESERILRRAEQLDDRAIKLDGLEERIEREEKRYQALLLETEEKLRRADETLYRVSGMSPDEAREMILKRVEEELEDEKAVRVKAMLDKVSTEAKRKSQDILAQAIQRSASETSSAMAVTVVPIPSEAMKGRIIGREGRNIRAFESLTGVDLIIDDTPEVVLLSSFNPIRREVAAKALEQLVVDGRIHPTRIEEIVQKAKEDMQGFILERGEEAALEANVIGLKPGLLQLLGRMYFRQSYAQNVLKHSIQVAHLCGIMANELGLDALMARRAGLLHDVGKSIDREIEGTHVDIGINLAKRFSEPLEVIDAIAHHHDPENAETVYAVLAAAADAVSAARPGARRESLEVYIKRLEQLEKIAVSFQGVENAYAIQAGREVRVIVEPHKINENKAALLARQIAQRIEQDMEYPGQVQVTVVRETRSVEYAK